MRVLYFMNHVGRGGAALALLDLIREIKKNHDDVEPIVFTGTHNELNIALNSLDVENYVAPYVNFLTSFRRPIKLWQFVLQLRYNIFRKRAISKIERCIDFKTIDIIHSNLNRIDIGFYFSKKYGIPHVWHIREDGFYGLKLMQVFPKYNPIMNDNEAYFITISDYVKNAWTSKGLPIHRISSVFDGINEDLYVTDTPVNKNMKFSIVFVGGFHENKGQELFIHALNHLSPDVKNNIIVHFYGDGPSHYMRKINSLIAHYDLSSVCTIFKYDPKISEKIRMYHVGVNCSKAEGFGRVTVEYMMSGLCTLLSYGGANGELVTNGVEGLFFDRNNPFDISSKIEFLFNNQKQMEIMAAAGRTKATEFFTMETHANKICDLYSKIC